VSGEGRTRSGGAEDEHEAEADACFRRGDVLRGLGRWEEALVSYGRAAAHRPSDVDALCNVGNVLRELGRWPEALAAYDRAIAIRPDNAMAHANRGVVLKELRRFDQAVASLDRAIELRPDYASAHFNRGMVLLLLGQLQPGWAGYEWRWEDAGGSVYRERRPFPHPRWHGQAVAGKTVLLHGEQGYGDVLQFCRYARLLAEQGAEVVLEARAPLVSLLADLDGVSRLVTLGGSLPAFDYHCPLMSLPFAFGTSLGTIPQSTPYLRSDAGKVEFWQAQLGAKDRPRVGLAWSGNPAHISDRSRSIELSRLLQGLPTGYQYVSLQKDVRATDRPVLDSAGIVDVSREMHDFSDTAALCDCLDVVISVDTSVAHLSAALGRPTWILLAALPDWRWMLGRTDSPWYSSVTLYRQDEPDAWEGALLRVTADLGRACAPRQDSPG
jgi:TPR repeat/Tetratricopeptide repeat/Glycosyltransferase family 9 (heptosyltransferase)